jgi:hypothetical protein
MARRGFLEADGVCSSQPTGAQNQATALRAEGVIVTQGALGELMVDFSEFGWFPRHLPSQDSDGSDSQDEDEEFPDAEPEEREQPEENEENEVPEETRGTGRRRRGGR